MKRTLFSVLLVVACIFAYAQPWYPINPANGHQHLNDISFLSANEGMAVADGGVIIYYNGIKWSRMESPVTDNLNAVQLVNSDLAYAVGNNGIVLKYNGSDWSVEDTPVTADLKDISFVDESNIWAAGNTILNYNGTAWTVQADISNLNTISFANANEGWAAGSSVNLHHFINGSWEVDNTFEDSDLLIIESIQMFGNHTIKFNASTLEGEGITYENTGSGWELLINSGPNTGASFASAEYGFGIENRTGISLDTYPSIYKFENEVWTKEYTAGYNSVFSSVDALNDNEAYATDTDGFIYHGLNSEWELSNGFTTENILDICFLVENNGFFACGSNGIWHYNAGVWTNELNVPGYIFNEVNFQWSDFGWAFAYGLSPIPEIYDVQVYMYSDGQWSLVEIPELAGQLTSPISSMAIYNSSAFTSLNQVFVLDWNNEWTVSSIPPNDSITELDFTDIIVDKNVDSHGNISGNKDVSDFPWFIGYVCTKRTDGDYKGAIYTTTYGSIEWELSYETYTGAFNDIDVIDNSEFAIAVGDNGLMAVSYGENWSEFEPLTNEDLLSVYLNYDFTAWAVGRNGTTLYFDGTIWSVIPNFTSNDLYSVNFAPYSSLGLTGGFRGTLFATLPELPTPVANINKPSDNQTLSIFPNPVNSSCNFTINALHNGTAEYEISDLSGRKVMQGKTTVTSDSNNSSTGVINTTNLQDGMYILKVRSGEVVKSAKFIK